VLITAKWMTHPVSQFGSEGEGDGQFHSPRCVACNSRGEIVIADGHNHRIQVFDRDGKFLFKFGPCGVTVDQRNNQIVVADTYNCRIQIFEMRKELFFVVLGRMVRMIRVLLHLAWLLINKGIML